MFKKSKIIVGAALLAVSVLSFTLHSRLKPSTWQYCRQSRRRRQGTAGNQQGTELL